MNAAADHPGPRVALTGMGVITALGHDARVVYRRLLAGDTGVTARRVVPRAYDTAHAVAAVDDLAPLTGVGPGEKFMDRSSRMGLAAIVRALADAGLADSRDVDQPIGIVLAPWLPAAGTIQRFVDSYDGEGPLAASPMDFANCAFNAVASQAGIRLKLGAVNVTTIAGAVSGLAALEFACRQLAEGVAARLVVCGVQELNPTTAACCAAEGLLTTTAGRPFDRDRDGMALGEGACALVIERADAARARGAIVRAELDAPWIEYVPELEDDALEPAATAMAAVLGAAMQRAGADPSAIGHVSASARGVRRLDAVEGAALLRTLGDGPVVGTLKGALGEWAGAAPLLQTALAALVLADGIVPPVSGLRVPDPAFHGLRLARAPAERSADVALVSSLCWSGMAGAMALRRER